MLRGVINVVFVLGQQSMEVRMGFGVRFVRACFKEGECEVDRVRIWISFG